MKNLLPFFAIVFLVTVSTGADWRQFRGTLGNSVAADANLPIEWNEDKNIAWTADLVGRGPSSPIVVDGRVIVTASGGVRQDRLYVLAFDADSGESLWRREFWATGRTLTHPESAVAAPTPASDGKRIFAFYSSNDLICLDLDGNLLWYRGLAHDYPKAGNDVGMSASPVVVDETVIVQLENQGDSFATGIDVVTGEERWRIDRDARANWTSPVGLEINGQNVVLLQSPATGISAHNPLTGETIWTFKANSGGIASPIANDGRVFFASKGITALNVATGSVEPSVEWDSNQLNPSSASPLLFAGRIYTMNRGGILTCGSADDGKKLWQLRLGGTHWATPVIAGEHIYCVSFEGEVKVVSLGEKGEVVATNQFPEKIQGTPAVVGDAMYIKSDQHLWKIASEK
ncbi:MAG: PQQ-binding-like beta-propeller repeat protein [Pirellulaceae bacterium]|nr:PQQ-binding-like beta-propeller repeat protein [Pirellulaceae bacterium]